MPPGTRLHPTLWSLLSLAAAAAYMAGPYDPLPAHLGMIGYLDDAGAGLAGLLGARLLSAPDRQAAPPALLPAWLRFRIRVLRADLGNFFFTQHRHVDGFLVTGKNSGSHWLKFMLSAGLAHKHGLALPRFSTGPQADSIVGHPRGKARLPGVPLIGTTHTIPSVLQPWLARRFARRPPIVVMVREIHAAMLSNYAKWAEQYPAALSEFAAGDPSGRRFIADAWWYVHFFNRWVPWARAEPDRVLLIRYEELVADPARVVRRVAAHLRLEFSETDLAAALAFTAKDAIRSRQDPNAGETIVPPAGHVRPAFTEPDLAVIAGILSRHLRADPGYAYAVKPR